MSDTSTKDRILSSASKVFCEKGFKATTVRDICTEADANVAAVNYHFGDKRKLYVKVLSLWISEIMTDTPTMNEIIRDLPVEGKLNAYIREELRALCTYNDPEKKKKRKIRLLLEEYVSENCKKELFKRHTMVEEQILFPIVRNLLYPITDQKVINQASVAASGIFVHHFLMILHYPEGEIESEERLDFMTNFYTSFILGSLRAIKDEYFQD